MTQFGWASTAFGAILLAMALAGLHPSLSAHIPFDALFWLGALWYAVTMFVGLRSIRRNRDTTPTPNATTATSEIQERITSYPQLAWALVRAMWQLQLVIYLILAVAYLAIWYAANSGGDTAAHLLRPEPWLIIGCVGSLLPAILVLTLGLCFCKSALAILEKSLDKAK